MYPSRYFPNRYFARRYWPKVGAVIVGVRQVFTLPGGLTVTQQLRGTYTVVQRVSRDVKGT